MQHCKKSYSKAVDEAMGKMPYSSANTGEGYRRSYPYPIANGVRTLHRRPDASETAKVRNFIAAKAKMVRKALDSAGFNDVEVTVGQYYGATLYIKVVAPVGTFPTK